jgi:hypothetical protein
VSCDDEIFQPRRFDGTSISITHAPGLVEELADINARTRLTQDAVLSKNVFDPPDYPEDCDRYIVPPGATGEWEDVENYIVQWDEEVDDWIPQEPLDGMLVFVDDEDVHYTYDGTSWETLESGSHTHATLPTVDQKAALAGTAGAPSATNRYVTDEDPRLGAGGGAGGMMTTRFYFVSHTELLGSDPTEVEVPTPVNGSDDANWRVLFVKEVPLKAGVDVLAGDLVLRWATVMSGPGGGFTKWIAIPSTGVTPGTIMPGSSVDLTIPVPVTSEKEDHRMSGTIRSDALTSGPFTVALVGRPNSAGSTVIPTILDESVIEVTIDQNP